MDVNGFKSQFLQTAAAQREQLAPERLKRLAKDASQVREVATEFESLFTGMVLETMRKTVPKEGFFSGGHAEEIYRSMLDEEYSKILAQQNQLGLAATIERQLIDSIGKTLKPSERAIWQQAIHSYSAKK